VGWGRQGWGMVGQQVLSDRQAGEITRGVLLHSRVTKEIVVMSCIFQKS
jgi:hypothetical protein